MDRLVVCRNGFLSMQVCMEKGCTDEEVHTFANTANPTGSETLQWRIRKQGDDLLAGDPERAQCEVDPDREHIMLDC